MIKQIKYFQAVVRYQSFTNAAEECYISQSAISQQIQALERELGLTLFKREKRKFSLTPAGEFFYRKSLLFINDFDKLCSDTILIAKGMQQELTIGYLNCYQGIELQKAIAEFKVENPDVALHMISATHEKLYEFLRSGKVDMVMSDLRRNPSNQYVNYYLRKGYFYAEIATQNSLANFTSVTMDDLKNTSCIIVVPKEKSAHEEGFYREYTGVKSDFLFADSLEEAHLMVVSGKGFMPIELKNIPKNKDVVVKYLPICLDGKQLYRDYYAFWKIDSTKTYTGKFALILKKHFT